MKYIMKKSLAIIICVCTILFAVACSNKNVTEDDTITIYFARHGKTIFNTIDRVQGWGDSPLTEPGIQVAKYLGEGLKGIKFDTFYTSDAGRQRQTMKIILAQQGVTDYKINELLDIREVFFGGYEGGTHEVMFAGSLKAAGGFKTGKAYLDAYHAGKVKQSVLIDTIAQTDSLKLAENYMQVRTRMLRGLDTMVANAKANGDKTILAVSSGTAIQIMLSGLTDDPATDRPLPNAAVIKIVYKNGQYTVEEIGSMKYVEKGKAVLDNMK